MLFLGDDRSASAQPDQGTQEADLVLLAHSGNTVILHAAKGPQVHYAVAVTAFSVRCSIVC